PSSAPSCAQQCTHLCPAVSTSATQKCHLPVPSSATHSVPPTCAHQCPSVQPSSAASQCPAVVPVSAQQLCQSMPNSAASQYLAVPPVSTSSDVSQCHLSVLSISTHHRCRLSL
ncbi:unnamed protein product, partial [Staurois parvus]